MPKRRLRNRFAVSTVIANMLMIVITLSLGVILVAWAGTSYGTFAGGTQVFFEQRGQALQERLVIEEVFFNITGSNHRLLVFIRNVGAEEIKIVAIYVNGTSLTPTGSGGTCTLTGTPPSRVLPVAAVCEFNLDWGSTWQPGSIFMVIVATARGNQASATARGP